MAWGGGFGNPTSKTQHLKPSLILSSSTPKTFLMPNAWKEYQEKNKDRFLNEMLDLLRIPSVSAKSEHKADMQKCADAVKKCLLKAGCDKAEVMPTAGH